MEQVLDRESGALKVGKGGFLKKENMTLGILLLCKYKVCSLLFERILKEDSSFRDQFHYILTFTIHRLKAPI